MAVLRSLALIALASLGLGCQTLLDLERARSLFTPAPRTEIPILVETPAAKLPPVRGLQLIGGQLRQIPLSWDPLPDGTVAGYTVERALRAKGPYERVGSVAGRHRTEWLDRGSDLAAKHESPRGGGDLGDGHTYFYRVRAFDEAGRLAPVDAALVGTASTAPAPSPPTGFQAFSRLPRRVALRWEASPDPTTTGYVVYRSPSSKGSFEARAQIDGRFTTTWRDLGLGDLRVFYYRVAARNAWGGIGTPTDRARAVTKPEPLPPIGLEVSRQELGRNELSWSANVEPDLEHYRLLRRRQDGTVEQVAETDEATRVALDDALAAGEVVEYSLIAIDRDGLVSAMSTPLEVAAIDYGLRTEVRSGGIELSWSGRAHADVSEMRVIRVNRLGEREVGRSREPQYTITGLEPGQRIQVRIIGVRPDGSEAPPSVAVDATLPDAAR